MDSENLGCVMKELFVPEIMCVMVNINECSGLDALNLFGNFGTRNECNIGKSI